jgi:hypothetical protein
MEVFLLKHELLQSRQDELARVRQLREAAAEVLQSLQNVKERIETNQMPHWPSSPTWTWESDVPEFTDDNIEHWDEEFKRESSQDLPQTGNSE